MTATVQVEFRESSLSIRDEILQSHRYPVISALGAVLGEISIPCIEQ